VPTSLVPSTRPTAGQALRWAFNHLDLIGNYADAAPALLSATTFNGRWLIVRPLGDATAPALDELFNQAVPRGEPETAEEFRKLEDDLLLHVNSRRAPGEKRDRKWLKAALAALKIGIPMFAPEAAQWVGILDLLAN